MKREIGCQPAQGSPEIGYRQVRSRVCLLSEVGARRSWAVTTQLVPVGIVRQRKNRMGAKGSLHSEGCQAELSQIDRSRGGRHKNGSGGNVIRSRAQGEGAENAGMMLL